MSRYPYGSPRDPLLIQFDRPSTLHEAKLASWALATGASLPYSGASRRLAHRGMLPDVLPPEPRPPNVARPPLSVRLRQALRTLFGRGRPSVSPAGMPATAVADGSNITYIDRTNGTGAAAPTADCNGEPIRSRAA